MRSLVVLKYLLFYGLIGIAHFAPGQPAGVESADSMLANYEGQLHSYFNKYLVDDYEKRSGKAWNRDYSNPDALLSSVAPNRERWRKVLNPPVLPKSGPLKSRPHPTAGVDASWIELPMGLITAQALLAFPEGATSSNPAPLVIVVHGMRGTPESVFQPGIYHSCAKSLLEAGFAVLAPMNLSVRETRNTIDQYARLAGTSLAGIELARLQHLLDVVLVDPRVDADRVGMWGLSLGGMATMFAIPVEPRIKAGIVSAWFADRRKKMAVPDPRYGSFSPGADHAFLHGWLTEFTDADVVSLIAPRALMIQHGKQDRIAHWTHVAEEFEKAAVHYRKLNLEDRVELVLHEGGHEMVVEEGVRFLETWLKSTKERGKIIRK